jgi:hypothetical protein
MSATKSPVVITVVWHPDDPDAKELALGISKAFNVVGTARDGVGQRVPVYFRSVPLDPEGGPPRPLTRRASHLDALVVINSAPLQIQTEIFAPYLAAAREALGDNALYLDLWLSPQRVNWAGANFQAIRWREWTGLSHDAKFARLLLAIAHAIRCRLRQTVIASRRETIFISHAKFDGDENAKKIVTYVRSPDNDIQLDTFYDAKELVGGEDFAAVFENEIAEGAVLALCTDEYDMRPWCNREILWAKRHRRPIILCDLRSRRVARTFPYGANVPLVRLASIDPANIEALMLEIVLEGLRCDIFVAEVAERVDNGAVAFPRPPELVDLVFQNATAGDIIYPDPPLPNHEVDLLQGFLGGRKVLTLGQATT